MDGRRGRPQSQTRCRGECKALNATCGAKPYAPLASRLRDTHLSSGVTHRTRRPRATGGAVSGMPAKCLCSAVRRALPDGGGGGPGSADGDRVKIRLWEYVLTYKDVTGTGCRKVLQLQKICSWPSYAGKGAFGVDWGRKCKSEKVRAGSPKNPCRKVLQLQKRACCGRGSRTCGGRTGGGAREGRASGTTPSPEAVGRSFRDRDARALARTSRPHVRECKRLVVRSPTRPQAHISAPRGGFPPQGAGIGRLPVAA